MDNSENLIEGTIIHIEQHDERPSRNVYKTMSCMLLLPILFIPYLFVSIFSLALSLTFSIMGFYSLARFFNPVIWTIAFLGFGGIYVASRSREAAPLYRGLLDDGRSRIIHFQMQGPLKSGNLIKGHQVKLKGNGQGGNFLAFRGSDITTKSEIMSGIQVFWKGFFWLILLFLIFCLIGAIMGNV
jgi:hypothetical protein